MRPDGLKVAWATGPSGNQEIWTSNPDGSGAVRLTNNAFEDSYPSWSPDGTKIAFHSNRSGNYEVWSMNADGSGPVNLTNNASLDMQASWSGNGSKIAFFSYRFGTPEIMTMNPDGTNPVRLTNNAQDDREPDFSPDGTKIVFTRYVVAGQPRLFTMNADGSGQTQIATLESLQPAFSPDGTRIAYMTTRDGNAEVYMIDPDGTDDTRVTNNPAYDAEPSWGTNVAVGTAEIGNRVWDDLDSDGVQDGGEPGLGGVTVRLLDGGGATITSVVTGGSGDYVFGALQAGTYAVEVVVPAGRVLSPAGQGGDTGLDSDVNPLTARTAQIVLGAAQVRTDVDAGLRVSPAGTTNGRISYYWNAGASHELRSMMPDGSSVRSLSTSASAVWSSWSPDGSQLAFVWGPLGNEDIWVIDADGTGATQLTSAAGTDREPAWSPDGNHIAFFSTRDGNPEIYVMDADGNNETRLTNHASIDFGPTWSADGTRIAFATGRYGGTNEIAVMRGDGADVVRLTSNAVDDREPNWSRDGARIAFTQIPTPGQYRIWSMNPDGTAPLQLTTLVGLHPTWSPDSTQIAFTTDRDGNAEIYRMNADGTGQTRITNSPDYEGNSSWGSGVGAPNSPPTADPQAVQVDEDGALPVTLTGTDPDLDPLAFAVADPPDHGQLSGTSPNLTYTPDADWFGPDSFSFTADDGLASSPAATVSITVAPVNDAPDADPQNLTMDENASLPITLTGSDIEGDTLGFQVDAMPQYGMVSGSGASITYTPPPDWTGVASFTFVALDGSLGSAPETVTISVGEVDDPPQASMPGLQTPEDTPLGFQLSGSDPDSEALVYTIIDGPDHGTLTGTLPSLTFTPVLDYNGPDSFSYQISDGTNLSNVEVVELLIGAVNDVPVPMAQAVVVSEDGSVPITLTATDTEGDPVTFTVAGKPMHGTLAGAGSSWTYTPEPDFNGADDFLFLGSDLFGESSTAAVSITVTPTNDPPVALPQVATTDEDTPVAITFEGDDIDGDALSFAVASGPASGGLSGSGSSRTYTPTPGFSGVDSFTFTADDGTGPSAPATVTIEVRAVNDAPTATPVGASGPEETEIAVLVGGTDPEGDALTYALVTPPVHGTLGGELPALTYTPAVDFFGVDTFTFTVNDGQVTSATATATVTVTNVNDPAIALVSTATTSEDQPVVITLTGTDPDGDAFSLAVDTAPGSGLLTGTVPTLTYSPFPNLNGEDTFTFTADDGSGPSAPATFTLEVRPVNDPPAANPQVLAATEDTDLAITLTGSDPDGGALQFQVTSGPAKGVLSGIQPNLLYTPDPDVSGADNFKVRVSDGIAWSAVATIAITVAPSNDPPRANPGGVSTLENTAVVVKLSGSDVDLNPLTYAVTDPPDSGTLTGTGATRTYTPNPGFSGEDLLQFVVNDGTVDSAPATVEIHVAEVNEAPLADSQSIVVPEDGSLPVTLSGSDPDGDPISYSVVAKPIHGVLDGVMPNLTYVADPNYSGADTFTFKTFDSKLYSTVATVTVAVAPSADPPVANLRAITVSEDANGTVVLTGSDPDGDPLTFTVTDLPDNGTLTGTGASRVYRANLNWNGTDTFTYVANDGTSNSTPVTVTVTVLPVNDAPVLATWGGPFTLQENDSVGIMSNATDPDGDPFRCAIVAGPMAGATASVSSVPTTYAFPINYRPARDYAGIDGISVACTDGVLTSVAVTYQFQMTPVNTPPVASSRLISGREDKLVTLKMLVQDPDSTTFTAQIVSPPATGTATVINGDSIRYTPPANVNGYVAMTYRVFDGQAWSNVAVLTIYLDPVADPPLIIGFNPGTATEGQVSTSFQTVAVDPDGQAQTDALSVSYLVTAPNLTVMAGGEYTGSAYCSSGLRCKYFNFQQLARQWGTYTVTVTVRDPSGNIGYVTRSFTVTDAPAKLDYIDGEVGNTIFVACLRDSNLYSRKGDWVTQIHWGDGSSDAPYASDPFPQYCPNPNGAPGYLIGGAHNFGPLPAGQNQYTLRATATSAGGGLVQESRRRRFRR